MYARTLFGLYGLYVLLASPQPAFAEDLVPAAGLPAAAVAAPAYSSANFRQETIIAPCTRFTSTGTFWTCSGLGTKVGGSKLMVVDNISCRSNASGGLTRTQVDIRQGTGTTYDWTDLLSLPMTTTFSLSGLVYQANSVPVSYLVPVGHRLWVEIGLTGTAMYSAAASCTVTGRFVAP